MAQPQVREARDQQQLEWIGGSTLRMLLDGEDTAGQLMVMRSALQAGDASPLHVHGKEDEIFVLLTGAAVVWVGEQRHEAGAGAAVYLPRDIPHAYRITSDTADMLTLCTPAGLEGFFRGAGHDRSEPKPEGWSVTPAVLGQVMAEHGGTILGPPPA